MRRARIVRIEWEVLARDETGREILTAVDIEETLQESYRDDLKITVTGEPSFTVKESGAK
jgi:hypothetical protein